MQAVIMAGGKGTRLFPLTNRLPKPMVDFLNRPTLEHLVKNLAAARPKQVLLTLGYRHELVSRHFGNGEDFGVDISYSVEAQPLGTAGGVKALEPVLRDTFLVLSGDAVCDLDFREPLRFHRANRADVTLVLTRVDNPLEFGIVVTDDDDRITRFLEKPATWAEVFTDVVNTGIYVIEPHVLQRIPAASFYDFSKDLFPRLLNDGARIYGMLTDAYWCDVGNLVQYRQAHLDGLLGRIRISIPHSRQPAPGIYVGEGARLSRTARLHPPVLIGPRVHIGAGCSIGPFVVVGDEVRVQEQVAVAESVILRGSHIGCNCSLFGCVIAENTTIRPDTYWQHVAADQQHLTRVARRKEAPIPPGFPAGREWRRERVAQADPLSSTAPLPGG